MHRTVVGLAALAWAGGCKGDAGVGTLEPSPSVIVSAPTATALASSPNVAGAPGAVYVSMIPGSVPNGVVATVQPAGAVTFVTAPMVDGGFDPVSIVAAAGQTVDVEIRLSAGASTHLTSVVPASYRPVIVRTAPASGSRAVPLDAIVDIVFSEPVAPGSLTTTSVQLSRNGTLVAGTVAPIAGSSTGVSVTPAALLEANASYRLFVTPGVTDPSGIALGPVSAVTFTTGSTLSIPPGSWASVAPMRHQRIAPAVGVINGSVYVAGGWADPDTALRDLERYDPSTGQWTSLTPMPTGRTGAGAAVIAGILYVVGGSDSTGAPLDALEAYDPATDSWTTMTPMPSRRAWLAAAAANDTLYAIGGQGIVSGDTLNTVQIYDPTADRWHTRMPMPTKRYAAGVGVIGGIIYVVGGLVQVTVPDCTGGALHTLEAYDPATDSWTERSPMPTKRGALGVAVLGTSLYAVGGHESIDCSGADVTGLVEVYDPARDRWTTRTPMPTPRAYLAAGAAGTHLYAIGGLFVSTVEAYSP